MNIQLNKLIPTPLADSINPNSGVWNKEVIFSQGKTYLIDARSGKGKSTFIHSLYGIRRDYTGTISIEDRKLKKYEKDELATLRQSHLSIVFQDLRLFPHLTASENIKINSLLAHSTMANKLPEIYTRLQISHLVDKPAGLLSYGEQQRFAIVRAITQPFDWLLLDEPFAHLDKENTLAAYQLIQEAVKINQAGLILTSLGEDAFISYDYKLNL